MVVRMNKELINRVIYTILPLFVGIICCGCSPNSYMVNIDTGMKTRVINIDKHIRTDKSGQNRQYYITKIEEYPGLAVIYISYEGKNLVLLSKTGEKKKNLEKIQEHKFYNLSLVPTMEPTYKSPMLKHPLPAPKIYNYAGYVINWEFKNISENDVYLSPDIDGLYLKDSNSTFPSQVTGMNGTLKFNVLSDSTVEVALGDYSHLDSIIVPDKVSLSGKEFNVASIGDSAFFRCTKLSFIIIPNSIKSIGHQSFLGCTALATIDLPNSLSSIENSAFAECTSLTSITIPNGVTSIKDNAFGKCTSLTDINLPNSVDSIGNGAFSECKELSSIDIPNNVTSIGDFAFWGCSRLSSIVISNRIISIGNEAFSKCTGLKSIVIPSNVISIGDGAFSECTGLTSIDIPNNVTTIGANAFAHCSRLTSVNMANSVTSIGEYAFFGCTGLSSIIISNKVAHIEFATFYDCSGLSSIVIPNSVTAIEANAFAQCSSLTAINIPNSVTSIGYEAFIGCENLNITINNKKRNVIVEVSSFEGVRSVSWKE